MKFFTSLSLLFIAASVSQAQAVFHKNIFPNLYSEIVTLSSSSTHTFLSMNKGYGKTTEKYVVKLDNSGNMAWNENFNDTLFYRIDQIKATADGGCVIATNRGKTQDSLMVCKLDANGVISWQKNFNYESLPNAKAPSNTISDMIVTTSGDIFLAIRYWESDGSNGTKLSFCYLLKLSATGNIIFARKYVRAGQLSPDPMYTITEISPNLFVIAGRKEFGNNWAMGIDGNGAQVWTRSYNTVQKADYVISLLAGIGKYFLITGNNYSNIFCITEINTSGVKTGARVFYSPKTFRIKKAAPSGDGGVIIAGYGTDDSSKSATFYCRIASDFTTVNFSKMGYEPKTNNNGPAGITSAPGGGFYIATYMDTSSIYYFRYPFSVLEKIDGSGNGDFCRMNNTPLSDSAATFSDLAFPLTDTIFTNKITVNNMNITATASPYTEGPVSCGPVGMSASERKEEISIYPSPTDGILYFKGAELFNGSVYNTSGQLVFSFSHTGKINIHALPAGIYFVQLRDEMGNVVGVRKVSKL